MKGIVLAGGTGSRLWPVTKVISKQLLPVYDKPMVYYPISTLMLAGIRDILVICTPQDLKNFEFLLKDGTQWGISIKFCTQEKPKGIAEAFLIGEKFIGTESIALILGDNIFHGQGLGNNLRQYSVVSGAQIFGYKVNNPEEYGVAIIDVTGRVSQIVEKPTEKISKWAVPGLYFYDHSVIERAKELKPSIRGELEITDINLSYLADDELSIQLLQRGTVWFDSGTVDSINHASEYVRIIEERQGTKIGCPEEIAWNSGWISDAQLQITSKSYANSPYGQYLFNLVERRY